MEPVNFGESNKTLQKPSSMTDEECGPLYIYNDDKVCISKWRMGWKERLHCLFRGYVWLWVMSGSTQPPVVLEAKKTVFQDGGEG